MTHSPLLRTHLWIRGRVQGVAFRKSTRARAEALGLSGWVRNLGDGRVELVAEGPWGAVEALVSWVAAGGPPLGRVDAVDRADEAPTGAAPPYRVLPDGP